jgi:hypothetical protein
MPISASGVLCCLHCLQQNTLQLHQLWSHTALLPMQPARVSFNESAAACQPFYVKGLHSAIQVHVFAQRVLCLSMYFEMMQDKQLAHLDNVPIPEGCGASCQLDSAGPSQQPSPMPNRGQCRAQQERKINAGPAVFDQQALRAHRFMLTGRRIR